MATSAVPTPPDTSLASEASHRIANQLATLVALVDKQRQAVCEGPELLPRAAVADSLAAVSGKLRAMAELHHRLTAQPEQDEVEVNEALVDILRGFQAIFGERVRMNPAAGDGCRLKSRQLSMVALAFAEIVTNALKYAHPTGLPVEFSISSRQTADGGIELTVSDDGVGMPEGFDMNRDGGTGLKLVQALVTGAGGRLSACSSELGLAFSIEIPGPHRRTQKSNDASRFGERPAAESK